MQCHKFVEFDGGIGVPRAITARDEHVARPFVSQAFNRAAAVYILKLGPVYRGNRIIQTTNCMELRLEIFDG